SKPAAVAGGLPVALPSAHARIGRVSANGDSGFLRRGTDFRFCELRRLPLRGRYVRFIAMHANTAGGSTHEDQEAHRSSREGGSPTHRGGTGLAATMAVAGLLAGCQTFAP